MKLDIGTEKDSFNLCEFYSQFTDLGLFEAKTLRHPDFFAQYKSQSSDYKLFTLKDEDQAIQATAAFVFRNVLLNGEVKRIATATDIRLANTRAATLHFARNFLPVLEQIIEDYEVDSVLSGVNLSDPNFISNFIRPRTAKRPMPRYFLYRKFNLVSVHGVFPWAPGKLRSIKVENVNSKNLPQFVEYLKKRAHFRPFSSVWDQESLEKKINLLPGMKLENFLFAKSSTGEILGSMGYWNPLPIKSVVPLSYGLRAHNFRQLLKFMWLFGLTRRLAKPIRSTGVERPFDMNFLMNIHSENEDVFDSLLTEAYAQTGPRNFLVYAQVEQDYRLLPPKHWVSSEIPHALYTVIGHDQKSPHFLDATNPQNPEVEAMWI